MDLNSNLEIIKFNNTTELDNLESFADIINYRGKDFKIYFSENNGEKTATKIIRLDLPATFANSSTISKERLKKVITNRNFNIYDVRSAEHFQKGHLPGAKPLPARFFPQYRTNLPEDKASPIVFYGSDDFLSHIALIKTRDLGYNNVKVFTNGYQEWSSTEYVIVSINWLQEAINQNTPLLLIDLRPGKDIINGHIIGAVNIPSTNLDRNRTNFPARKDTQIVLYGPDSKYGATKLISWGYNSVGIISASFDGWQATSSLVDNGPIRTTIPPTSKTKPDTISLEEFSNLAASMDGSNLFIDVRTPEEFRKGSIPEAVNIPITDLNRWLSKLPNDQDIILFSNKGARAEMAHAILNLAKHKNRYLGAELRLETTGLNYSGN